jgi:hypothetical protein
MIDRSALGQTIASDTAHVLYPLCDCRLLHSLVNGRISVSGTRRGHTAKGIDSYYIGRNSGACRHTDNDYGLSESHEERQYRSRPPLLRALDQTAVAFVPLSARDQIGATKRVFFQS